MSVLNAAAFESEFLRTLHKRSIQREAELKVQLRKKKQQVADLTETLEWKEKTIRQLTVQNEWLRKQVFGRSTEQRKSKDREKTSRTEQDPQKKDPIDAWKLAEYMRRGRTHPVYYPVDEDIAVFKKTVQHYGDLTDQQAIEVKTFHRFLRGEL